MIIIINILNSVCFSLWQRDEADGEIYLHHCLRVEEFDADKNYGLQLHVRTCHKCFKRTTNHEKWRIFRMCPEPLWLICRCMMDWWPCQRWPPESGGTGSTHWGGGSPSGIQLKASSMIKLRGKIKAENQLVVNFTKTCLKREDFFR